MRSKLPNSLSEVRFPLLWQDGRRLTAHALCIKYQEGGSSHFSGGQASHKGSRCPQCKNKLTLLWDLDLNDELIPDFVRQGFAPATRLPFYICWQCVGAAYSISSDSRLKCYPFTRTMDTLGEGESPFCDSPSELERRSVSLERIPTAVEALLNLADNVGFDGFDKPAQSILMKYLKQYKNKYASWDDLSISQFGGQWHEYQSHGNMVCPNPKCPASKLECSVLESDAQYWMKEMALIDWRDEPVLAEHYFLLLYYVCGVCFSVSAHYSCT